MNKPLPANFLELRKLMSLTASIDDENKLSQIQSSIIFTHFATIASGLKCINRAGQPIQFPENWNQDFEGVYKFTYKVERENGKIIQFRLIDAGEGEGKINISFVQEDGDDLYQTQIRSFGQAEFEEQLKKYTKFIEQSLKLKETEKTANPTSPSRIVRLQPQWRQPVHQPFDNPFHDNQPRRRQDNPFGLPLTGDEYVGPNSGMFAGRGMGSPNMQNPSMRKPPGSRFDPIDPFGNQGFGDDPGSRDFSGFNNWGQPFGNGRNNFRGGF